jgi:hypothetical protein
MDTSRYYVKYFWFEYLSVMIQLIPYTLETCFITTTTLTILVSLLKYKIEGMRINFLLLVLCHMVYALELTTLHILMVCLYFYTIYLFRVYEVPFSRGNIGYRKMNLGHTSFELFYPTDDHQDE